MGIFDPFDILETIVDVTRLYEKGKAHLYDANQPTDPEQMKGALERFEDMIEAPLKAMLDPFEDEDPKDRSPIQLTRGDLVGHGMQVDDGWQLVVMLPEPRPRMIAVPRDRAGLGGVLTGDARFDQRVAVLGEGVPLPTLGQAVRSLWASARCNWLYAEGTLTARLPFFGTRRHRRAVLAHGLLLGEALVAAQDLSPPALLRALGDPAPAVAIAAFDALLMHPTSPELVEAYGMLLSDRSVERARVRVHALGIAGDWAALADEVRGLDPTARSDAFVALVARGPREHAAAAAVAALGPDGLDPERTRWVLEGLRDGAPRLLAATTPELRDRFLVGLIDIDDPTLEHLAADVLEASGTAVALAELTRRGPGALRSAALAARLRARLAGGKLALVDDDAQGGLAIADDGELDHQA